MTLAEAENRFGVSEERLRDYVAVGLIKSSAGREDEYCEQDFEHLGLIDLLLNAGFAPQEVRRYLELSADGASDAELIRMLRRRRCCVLDGIHARQKVLDCLDYMIWEKKHSDKR